MELKPCPFCGGKVFFHHNVREMTGENEIECEGCGVSILFDVDLDESQVEQLWNTRPGFEAGIKAGATREELGQMVREIWINYCLETGDDKPSHIAPWEELSDWDREVDMRIGETLFNQGKKAGIKIGARSAMKTFRDLV